MYRFQFETIFDDYKVLNRVYQKKEGTLRRLLRVGLFFILFTDISIRFNRCPAKLAELLSLLALTAMMAIVVEILRSVIMVRQSKRMSLQDVGELTITLDETGIHQHHKKCDSQYPWSAFVDGYYCRGQYLLFLDKLHAMGLPERALVEGDPATLRAFLEEKLQKEIIDVR